VQHLHEYSKSSHVTPLFIDCPLSFAPPKSGTSEALADPLILFGGRTRACRDHRQSEVPGRAAAAERLYDRLASRTSDLPRGSLSGFDRVPQRVSLDPVREDMRTLSRIVLATATTIGGMMGLVTYWIG
jgi:hypothetical protein